MTLVQNPKLLSYFCSLLSCTGILPIKFHPASRKIELLLKRSTKSKMYWSNRFHAILVITLIIQAFVQSQKLSLEGVHVWLGVLIHIFSHVFVHEHVKKIEEIALFCNAIFQFDDIYGGTSVKQKRATFRIKLIMMLVYCIVISTFAIPLGFVYGLHWFSPCRASLIGYWLIPECFGMERIFSAYFPKSILSIKLIIMLLNHWMVSISIYSSAFSLCVLTTMGIGSMQQYIQRLY